MKILLTGGSGLLGRNLVPLLKARDGDGTMFEHIEVDAPTHEELDILVQAHCLKFARNKYDLIIHAAAYTDVVDAETHKKKCYIDNIIGTQILTAFFNIPFVYISSEYAHNPVNYYSETKAAAEAAVKAGAEKYLIIRTLFKPSPFPYDTAFEDQWTQGDTVEVIAPLIADAILDWDKKSKLIYVGTGRKTILDIARKTKPDIKSSSIKDVVSVVLPKDYE